MIDFAFQPLLLRVGTTLLQQVDYDWYTAEFFHTRLVLLIGDVAHSHAQSRYDPKGRVRHLGAGCFDDQKPDHFGYGMHLGNLVLSINQLAFFDLFLLRLIVCPAPLPFCLR